MLLVNILLALIWAALTGKLDPANLAIGFVLGYLVLFLTRNALGSRLYSIKVYRTVGFVLYFLWELVLANLRVAADEISPRQKMRPGLIAIPLAARSDAEITVLANLITLTPGTLTLDVSTDRRVMYIHDMYVRDADESRRKIKRLEGKLLGVLR